MSQNPPQTLSVKRKRTEAPVDALIFDSTVKRQKSTPTFAYRRLTKPNDAPPQNLGDVPPTPSTERRFHLDPIAKGRSKHVFIEAHQTPEFTSQTQNKTTSSVPTINHDTQTEDRPRKRPTRGSALRGTSMTRPVEPSKEDVQALHALSAEVEKTDNLTIPLPVSPSKFRPKAPAQRFAERHPEKAAALAENGDDAMDIDTDEYVYDTYVREPILPNAPAPTGTVGLLVLADSDDEWWNGSDSSDNDASDDEDENAEDYYANDYPEDEMSSDDEFGRDAYKSRYRRGSEGEEWNARDSEEEDDAAVGSGDEDDLHAKMVAGTKLKKGVYWGAYGEGK